MKLVNAVRTLNRRYNVHASLIDKRNGKTYLSISAHPYLLKQDQRFIDLTVNDVGDDTISISTYWQDHASGESNNVSIFLPTSVARELRDRLTEELGNY